MASESRNPVITDRPVPALSRDQGLLGPRYPGPYEIARHSSAATIVSHRRFSWVPGAGTTGR